jgi:hypothetical protein
MRLLYRAFTGSLGRISMDVVIKISFIKLLDGLKASSMDRLNTHTSVFFADLR